MKKLILIVAGTTLFAPACRSEADLIDTSAEICWGGNPIDFELNDVATIEGVAIVFPNRLIEIHSRNCPGKFIRFLSNNEASSEIRSNLMGYCTDDCDNVFFGLNLTVRGRITTPAAEGMQECRANQISIVPEEIVSMSRLDFAEAQELFTLSNEVFRRQNDSNNGVDCIS